MSLPSSDTLQAPEEKREAAIQPPYSLEAEQELLGALLIYNRVYDPVGEFLRPTHFYDPLHGEIYEAISRLIDEGRPATPVTLKPFFEHNERLAPKGGVSYLGKLAGGAASAVNVLGLGYAIYDLALRRGLVNLGQDIYERALAPKLEDPPSLQIEDAEAALYKIAARSKYGEGFESFTTAVKSALEMTRLAQTSSVHLAGVATGLRDLDKKMGGLQPSDLIIIAGRPAMGKTALATNIAFNVARTYNQNHKEGAKVGFFSLEMSTEQLATRILAEQAHIPSHKLRRGNINQEEFQALVGTSKEIDALPLFIDETGGLSLPRLSARARRLKREQDIGLIVVDYLQLMTSDKRRGLENRTQEIGEITQGLKALAKELEIPIIALSQLSRQVEGREDKRPQLSDLRESGSIEQDADVVLFIFREEYYLSRKKPEDGTAENAKWQEQMEQISGKAEIIIGKHRHGPTGIIDLQFHSELTRFSDLAQHTYDDPTPQDDASDNIPY